MLAAMALAVTGGTLWCRALSAAAGGKRECRLGLTVGSLVLSALGLLSYAIIAAETRAAFLFSVCFVLAFSVTVTVLEAKYPLVKKQKILYDREGQFKGGSHQ